jgi:uncharacterized surface anchored protein
MQMRSQSLLIVLLLMTPPLVYAQSAKQSSAVGRIVGTVLNEAGQLVDHARVCTSITSGANTEINCRVSTDKDGRFQIEHLRTGTYNVFAQKEEEGYTISNQSPGQKVEITIEQSFAIVTIRLRPKGGILVGSVKDKTSGKPVEAIAVRYLAVDKGDAGFTRANGNFQITVPTATDLIIVVSAEGYKGWVYTDPSDPSHPVLRLASGEQRLLDIELEPLSKEPTVQ